MSLIANRRATPRISVRSYPTSGQTFISLNSALVRLMGLHDTPYMAIDYEPERIILIASQSDTYQGVAAFRLMRDGGTTSDNRVLVLGRRLTTEQMPRLQPGKYQPRIDGAQIIFDLPPPNVRMATVQDIEQELRDLGVPVPQNDAAPGKPVERGTAGRRYRRPGNR